MKLLLMQLLMIGTFGGFFAADSANAKMRLPEFCKTYEFEGKCGVSPAELTGVGLSSHIDYEDKVFVLRGPVKKGCQNNIKMTAYNHGGDFKVLMAFVDDEGKRINSDQFKSNCSSSLSDNESIELGLSLRLPLDRAEGDVFLSQYNPRSYDSPMEGTLVGKSPRKALQDEIDRNNLLASLENKCNERTNGEEEYEEYLAALEAVDGGVHSQTPGFNMESEREIWQANEKRKKLDLEVAGIKAALAEISNSSDPSASDFEKLIKIRDQILSLDNEVAVNGKGGHGLDAVPYIKELLDNDDQREHSLTHTLDEIMFDDGNFNEYVTKEHIEDFKATIDLAAKVTDSKARRAHLKLVSKRAKSAVKTKEGEEKVASLESRQEMIQELYEAGEYKEAKKLQKKLDSDYMEIVYGIKRTCKLGIFCSERRVGPGLAGAQGGIPQMPGANMNPQMMGMGGGMSSPWGMQGMNQMSPWGNQGMSPWMMGGRQPGSYWGGY